MERVKYTYSGKGITIVTVFEDNKLVWIFREDSSGVMASKVRGGEAVSPMVSDRPGTASVRGRNYSGTDVHRMLLSGVTVTTDEFHRYRYTNSNNTVDMISPIEIKPHSLQIYKILYPALVGEELKDIEFVALLERTAKRIINSQRSRRNSLARRDPIIKNHRT